MDDNGPITLKIPRIDQMNELDYVQYVYDEAVRAYLERPTYTNRAAFLEANQRLIETRYAYRKAEDLLRSYRLTHNLYPGAAPC